MCDAIKCLAVGPSKDGVKWLIISVILSSQVDMNVCIYVEQFILFPINSYMLLQPPMLTLFCVPT